MLDKVTYQNVAHPIPQYAHQPILSPSQTAMHTSIMQALILLYQEPEVLKMQKKTIKRSLPKKLLLKVSSIEKLRDHLHQ